MAHEHLTPSVVVLCKLASIAVHAEEAMSPDGHEYDRQALAPLFADADVRLWLDQMTAAALAPQKRRR